MTMWKIKRLIYRVKRVIGFIPVIWKGYDWDYGSALDVFEHQLKRTADYLESDKAQTLDAKINAAKIWTAIELMEKVYNEDYALEYFEVMENKYGLSSFDFVETGEKDMIGIFDENQNPLYTMEESYENNYTEEELKLIREEKSALHLECMAKQKRAHKLLWSYIEHNILKWWD